MEQRKLELRALTASHNQMFAGTSMFVTDSAYSEHFSFTITLPCHFPLHLQLDDPMASTLPQLRNETHNFAYHATSALSAIKPAPPLPPNPPARSRSQGALSCYSLKSPTPPIPAKSPQRNIPSPEPFRPLHLPTIVPTPPPRTRSRPHTRPPRPTHTTNAQLQLRDLIQPPTSYYAPVFRPHVPTTLAPTKKRIRPKGRHAWHNTRIALRVLIFTVMLIGLAIDLTQYTGARLDIILIYVAPCAILYNFIEVLSFVFFDRGVPPKVHLFVDFVLANALMIGGSVQLILGGAVKVVNAVGAMMVCSGVGQSAVWVLGVVGVVREKYGGT
ncbi:hypothetical protein CC86DRAFT_468462 [Ophiobolus disseminans]|uniref:Uncharacterized protein n=1 Tax=Ophiobolus disseminans TaxID=1469910 RepID=A0A6A6ZU76_9PLEO|nr:hypothetical protein CC86DRAFT_468462 [Ophiobolus disseminans]